MLLSPTDESDDIYVSVPFGTAGRDVELIQYMNGTSLPDKTV